MMKLHRILLQTFTIRHVRKINNCSCRNGQPLRKITNSFNMGPNIFSVNGASVNKNIGTTSVMLQSEAIVDTGVFEKVCEETLESLTEFFEELVENKDILKSADVAYSSGVLTINLGNNLGTYVINRQSPNRQIWLSSPKSGPKRYDYNVPGKYWIYKHDGMPLHKLLQSEISEIVGEEIDFSKCLYSKV